jgi:plastocyanin
MTRYRLFPLLLLFGLVALAPSLAAAAVVRGTVTLPEDLKSGRRFLGHWRVENTTVPIQPAPARGDTVVVLVGPKPQVLVPKNTPVEIAGMQASPATVVVGEGAVVEFRNSDKVSHDLSVPGRPDIMPPERLSPGTVRKVRFGLSGEYAARSIPILRSR